MTTYPDPEELLAKGLSWFEDESRWKKVKTQDGVDIYEGTEKSKFRQFRGVGVIDRPFKQVLAVTEDAEGRKNWNDKVISMEAVEKIDDHSVIIHATFNGSPVSNRDFCCYVITRHTDTDSLEVETSIVHEKCPEVKGVVRAHAVITGTRLQAIDENHTRMIYMGQIDLAGMVPAFVANFVNQGQPMVIARLREYIKTLPEEKTPEPAPAADS
ncbi:putative START domain containing protein [Blattamonas nauphoetae]|uniref:START domain containing protein n=1 Tax=Blattamonas nauphoetae TaxID=2049346 RepID=A0ABQ9XRV0_9EUKA|nr:putative START domain containing protein [Blattamonas nauphoetae]